ncbi:transcriptional regulator with XRE-family HTH domain [Lysinibacillus parviboronicapiens]|uniref:Transcriptional regulator with XRE-family HTH domain n=1 Tax=Lysinibacillus parviboronicapiens TaxID=436516 RepID=A0ABV2PRC5_9BACI
MKLTTSEKIKIILGRKNMTVKDLADKLGTTRQNLHNKMTRNNFNESDLEKISEALEINYEVIFLMVDGEKIL